MSKHRDLKLQKEIASNPCLVCGNTETVVAAHIMSVGSRPDLAKYEWNMMPLCVIHHFEQEASLDKFVAMYNLHDEMKRRGFAYNQDYRKWYVPYKGENSWI